jgi:hypothetical protein
MADRTQIAMRVFMEKIGRFLPIVGFLDRTTRLARSVDNGSSGAERPDWRARLGRRPPQDRRPARYRWPVDAVWRLPNRRSARGLALSRSRPDGGRNPQPAWIVRTQRVGEREAGIAQVAGDLVACRLDPFVNPGR